MSGSAALPSRPPLPLRRPRPVLEPAQHGPVPEERARQLTGQQVAGLATALLDWAQSQPEAYRVEAIRLQSGFTPRLYENPGITQAELVYTGSPDELTALLQRFGIRAQIVRVDHPPAYDAPPPYDDDEPLPPPDAAPAERPPVQAALPQAEADEDGDVPPPPPMDEPQVNPALNGPVLAHAIRRASDSELPDHLVLELDYCLNQYAHGHAAEVRTRFRNLIDQISQLRDHAMRIHSYNRIFHALNVPPSANRWSSRRFVRELLDEKLTPAVRNALPPNQRSLEIRDGLLDRLLK